MSELFEKTLVEQCTPTLAGIKPSNLFRFKKDLCREIKEEITYWNEKLNQKGIEIGILKECDVTSSCLVYVYRKNWMEQILSKEKNRKFLMEQGYGIQKNTVDYLKLLSQRLCVESGFPHEIGVFLGYPLEDVIGFIRHKGENYTCTGCWKSYGNPEEARKCFESYRTYTKVYKRKFEKGISLIQLAVAVG